MRQALSNLADRQQHWRISTRPGLRSRRVPTSAGALHYYDAAGTGALPTVVLLHGAAAAACHYDRLIALLRPRVRRVIALDAPGHGFSPVPPRLGPEVIDRGVAEALDGVLTEPAVIFGCSLGGAMAIRFALAHPGRARSLVLLSPAGGVMAPHEREELLTAVRMDTVAAAGAFVRRVMRRPPWYAPIMALETRRRFRTPHIRQLFTTVGGDDEFRADELASLRPPAHLIWGRDERLLPESCFRFFAEHLPAGTSIERPRHYAHAAFLEHPEQVAQQIVRAARATLASAPPPEVEARCSPYRRVGT